MLDRHASPIAGIINRLALILRDGLK